jgi:hypothetical protein
MSATKLDPDSRVCMVCGRVLDYHSGRGWAHTIADQPGLDHPAIPVTPDEAGDQVIGRCDFCYADEVKYTLPAESFIIGRHGSQGDWAACDGCAREIEKNAWNALLRRVLASHTARHGAPPPEVEQALRALYRELRKHVTGSLRPAT